MVSCTGMTGIVVRRPGNDDNALDEVDDDADDNDMVTVNDGFDHNNVCLQVHLREAWCNHRSLKSLVISLLSKVSKTEIQNFNILPLLNSYCKMMIFHVSCCTKLFL